MTVALASSPSTSFSPRPPSERGRTLELHFRPAVSRFISLVATGMSREVLALGTRGDGKTWGALGAMIAHAQAHHAAGFPLPTKWMGAASTFQSHKDKTHESLLAPGWEGAWRLRDDGHRAVFTVDDVELVHLRLFGVDDEHGMERLRAECHGVWFEEAAPAELISRGLSEAQWGMALSSMRLRSSSNVGMITENYPDDEHWTWRRFVVDRHPGTAYIRIPPGERATAEQRAQWAEGIVDPVMRRRLLEGKPGTIMPGRPVALGFNEDVHVSRTPLVPKMGATLYIGQDGGLMPASVIAQRVRARIEILASLSSQHAGIRQHFRYVVLPWLGEHAPWALRAGPDGVQVCYDPSLNTDSQGDSDVNPLRVMRELLPARYRAGVNVPWTWRRDPLLSALNAMDEGHPLVVLDPEHCRPLIKAWNGLWHYTVTNTGDVRKEEPKKPNPPWADLGDASAYLIAHMAPGREPDRRPRQTHARTDYSVYDYGRRPWQTRAAGSLS